MIGGELEQRLAKAEKMRKKYRVLLLWIDSRKPFAGLHLVQSVMSSRLVAQYNYATAKQARHWAQVKELRADYRKGVQCWLSSSQVSVSLSV